MPIEDADTPDTPGWWLKVLAEQLHNRRVGREGRLLWTRSKVQSSTIRPGLILLEDYRRGDPPLHDDIHSGWADPFRRFVRMGRLNIADLIVTSPSNRMGITDFRTAAANDELGDIEARRLMRRNSLKLVARDVHEYMLGLGDGYTITTPPDLGEGGRDFSLITAESPLQCITAHDPATGEYLAGLKMFRDDWDSTDLAYLFLPGKLHVATMEGPSSIRRRGRFMFSPKSWAWDDSKSDDVPDNQVAMTRFRNRGGVGEFERHLDSLDRINDKLFNEWWISKIQAFRQRAIKLPDEDEEVVSEGVAAEDAEQKNLLYDDDVDLAGIFTSAPDAMWRLPKDAEIWESATVDVSSLVTDIDKELHHLAAVLSIPLHTITPDAANGSAQGASLMREEHVYKVEDRRDRAEGSWARTMSLAFLFQGDVERSDITQIEPLWGPIERYSLQEKSQAARLQLGITPVEAIMTDVLQYSPAEVADRLRVLRAQDQLYGVQPAADAGTQAAAPAI